MNFNLSEEQAQIRDSIARFVSEHYAFDQRNSVVAMEHGFSAGHWQQFGQSGHVSGIWEAKTLRIVCAAQFCFCCWLCRCH